ncbi:hypothetical protein [Reinekea thalattae]|uniref:Nuclear transport factor 2 family protein n=1 Tax=Reinekea thalattae TaxID=2593301 RepID=A0A5C8Z4C2_9GAMM|nr:hypothetical protein [Reinekea thalattae]TXR52021.1 hypothetical protein FME95_11430 [Reinekea thalattae]
MNTLISAFFDAWSITDAESRAAKITSAVSDSIQYDDPRTPATITSISELADYVGMFSANAPGWTAKLVKADSIAGTTISATTRATIAFGGMGPDGKEMVQLGQYFIEYKGEKISRMVGFAGTGEAG